MWQHLRLCPLAERRYGAALALFVSDDTQRPKQCFICVGRAMGLSLEDPAVERLIQEFCSSSDLSRHFRLRHLRMVIKATAFSRILLGCKVCLFEDRPYVCHLGSSWRASRETMAVRWRVCKVPSNNNSVRHDNGQARCDDGLARIGHSN